VRIWLYLYLYQILLAVFGLLLVDNLVILAFELILLIEYHSSEDFVVDILNNEAIMFVN
jgi:hypothetical protein